MPSMKQILLLTFQIGNHFDFCFAVYDSSCSRFADQFIAKTDLDYSACSAPNTSALTLARDAHDTSGSSRGSRGRAKLTTPAGAKRARERADRLEQDAKRLREEADQFDSVRKINAGVCARENAMDKLARKEARAPQPARPLTNAMCVQPAVDHVHVRTKKRAKSSQSDMYDRLQIGHSIPGVFVFSGLLFV
jgi:hypothetical protein